MERRRDPGPGPWRRDPGDTPVSRSGWFYWVTKVVLTPIMTVYFRPRVTGRRNVPRRGAVMLACNHVSYLDWFALPLVVVRRRIVFLAKAEYFTRPGVRGRAQRFFFRATGQVPIDRSGGTAADAALRTSVRLLGGGAVLGVFPEGTRSPDGRLYRGRTGIARLAAQTGVPVVPCATVGLYESARRGRVIARPVRLTVRFGAPLRWPEGVEPTAEALRTWTDTLMQRIQELSGQEYVDADASASKRRAA